MMIAPFCTTAPVFLTPTVDCAWYARKSVHSHPSGPPVMIPIQMTSVLPLPTPAAVMVLAQWWIMKEPAIRARLVCTTKPWEATANGASSNARITACAHQHRHPQQHPMSSWLGIVLEVRAGLTRHCWPYLCCA
jgi:hypothetical protein